MPELNLCPSLPTNCVNSHNAEKRMTLVYVVCRKICSLLELVEHNLIGVHLSEDVKQTGYNFSLHKEIELLEL